MSRFAKNSAFFQQSKGQSNNFVVGAGDDDCVAVPKGKGPPGGDEPMLAGGGGTISEKGLINAFKRAKQSGIFIVQN